MSDAVEVAIVGAGPYGLSIGAHLGAARVSCRQFGLPMRLWQESMPKGMFLKSQGFASNLSSPDARHTLAAFCAETGRRYGNYGVPVPLETFIAYGHWFQRELVPDLEERLVTDVALRHGEYEVELADGQQVRAANVVVAAGVEHFASMPEQLAGLPAAVCTHSSAHADLTQFAGKSVVVLGAGQSALESAALLHEGGAEVKLVAREATIKWNGEPLPLERPLLQRMREPEAGLGSGWSTWLYSKHPELFRHLPESTRIHRVSTALGPAGAPWLRSRFEGHVNVLLEHTLLWAKVDGNGVILGLEGRDSVYELCADHVIAATGYRTDLDRLSFFDGDLRRRIRVVTGAPVVDRHYQSSVPGLYFAGPAVAPTFGPVMRFVYGTAHAANTVSGRLGATVPRAHVAGGARR